MSTENKDRQLTVDQASDLARLHPKTILRFIKEEKIHATKVGRTWRIPERDIVRFLHGGDEPETGESLRFAGTTENIPPAMRIEKIQVSSVIDIRVTDAEEAGRISNGFIAALNCKEPEWGESRYQFIFYEKELKAQIILWGSPLFMERMLSLIQALADSRRIG